MTARDRLVIAAVLAVALLGAMWLLVVSPERTTASRLGSQLATAQSSVSAAEQQVVAARASAAQYPAAYADVARLGKAVPPDEQVPSLIYQLDQAAGSRHVSFASLSAGSGSGAAPAASSSAATAAALTPMPFSLTFDGGFFALYHFLKSVSAFTTADGNSIAVNGRLLTVQSLSLAPSGGGGGLQAQVNATAYTVPSAATPGAPASPASTSTPATPAPAAH